jgi:hypothetical protein
MALRCITSRTMRLLFGSAFVVIVCGFCAATYHLNGATYKIHRKNWLEMFQRASRSRSRSSHLVSSSFSTASLADFISSCNLSAMHISCADVIFQSNMDSHHRSYQPCLWGRRSYKTGLGHQLTEVIMYSRLAHIYSLPHVFEKFSDDVSIHSSSYEWANAFFGLEANFVNLRSTVSTGHKSQENNEKKCREYLSVDSANCDELTAFRLKQDSPGNDCFRSPLMHMLFATFAPCFRQSSLCHGSWVAEAKSVQYDPAVVNVAWHIRVGDKDLYNSSSSYYR